MSQLPARNTYHVESSISLRLNTVFHVWKRQEGIRHSTHVAGPFKSWAAAQKRADKLAAEDGQPIKLTGGTIEHLSRMGKR